jgi:hypothetical protein
VAIRVSSSAFKPRVVAGLNYAKVDATATSCAENVVGAGDKWPLLGRNDAIVLR